MLKTIVRQAGKDSFAIGDGKYIKETDEYIKMIISNLRNNIIHTLYKLKKFLPNSANGIRI